jgi:hypothetical protein
MQIQAERNKALCNSDRMKKIVKKSCSIMSGMKKNVAELCDYGWNRVRNFKESRAIIGECGHNRQSGLSDPKQWQQPPKFGTSLILEQ